MTADATPYAGTSGWSGTDTSHDRAQAADESGQTHARQRHVVALLEYRGPEGLTVAELRDMTGWHHGNASSALSILHKTHRIERLQAKRNRCKIYVLPDHVQDRATENQGRSGSVRISADDLRELRRVYGLWLKNIPDEHPTRNLHGRTPGAVLEGQLSIDDVT